MHSWGQRCRKRSSPPTALHCNLSPASGHHALQPATPVLPRRQIGRSFRTKGVLDRRSGRPRDLGSQEGVRAHREARGNRRSEGYQSQDLLSCGRNGDIGDLAGLARTPILRKHLATGHLSPTGSAPTTPDQRGSDRPQEQKLPQTSRPRRVAEAALIRLHMLWWGCRLVRGCAFLWRRWRMFDMWVSRMQTKAPRPGPRTGLRRSKASLTHRAPGLQRANTWAIGLLPAGLSTTPTPEQRRW